MFELTTWERKHFSAKDGEQTFINWKREQHIEGDGFNFKIDTGKKDKRGFKVYFNAVSWGFYQGSDWRWYTFISYRSSDNKITVAYHWDVDSDGKATGTPRRHQWSN